MEPLAMRKDYRSPLAWIVLSVGLAGAYAGTAILCVSISAVVANVSWMLYIPAGLSFASALLWGRLVWPAVFVGELAMSLWAGQSLLTSGMMAFSDGLDAALVGWWFHDRRGRRVELDRIQEVMRLMAAEMLLFQPLCTAIGMLALVLGSHLALKYVPESAAAWYSSNLYAQFIVGPTVLAWLRWPRAAATKGGVLELAVVGTLAVLVGAIGPGQWSLHAIPLSVSLVLSFPLLAWAASRFVPTVALTCGAVIGLFACYGALSGRGPFESGSLGETMLSLNFFMAITIGTSIFLASAMANERRQEAEQAGLIEQLRAASTQVSRLKDIVTFCAWTGKVHLNDQWVTVEQFLHEQYRLNITHGISDEALNRLMADATASKAARAAGEAAARLPG